MLPVPARRYTLTIIFYSSKPITHPFSFRPSLSLSFVLGIRTSFQQTLFTDAHPFPFFRAVNESNAEAARPMNAPRSASTRSPTIRQLPIFLQILPAGTPVSAPASHRASFLTTASAYTLPHSIRTTRTRKLDKPGLRGPHATRTAPIPPTRPLPSHPLCPIPHAMRL